MRENAKTVWTRLGRCVPLLQADPAGLSDLLQRPRESSASRKAQRPTLAPASEQGWKRVGVCLLSSGGCSPATCRHRFTWCPYFLICHLLQNNSCVPQDICPNCRPKRVTFCFLTWPSLRNGYLAPIVVEVGKGQAAETRRAAFAQQRLTSVAAEARASLTPAFRRAPRPPPHPGRARARSLSAGLWSKPWQGLGSLHF